MNELDALKIAEMGAVSLATAFLIEEYGMTSDIWCDKFNKGKFNNPTILGVNNKLRDYEKEVDKLKEEFLLLKKLEKYYSR